MMKRDETFVHVAIRKFLKDSGWLLIAGQYPGGSDDELHTLNIYDPLLARDQSPDHRRHSFGKLVPDLIALKNKTLIVIEAKAEYSTSDKEKLEYLLTERKSDFLGILEKFAVDRGLENELSPVNQLILIPALAYLKEFSPSVSDDAMVHLEIIDLDNVEISGLIAE